MKVRVFASLRDVVGGSYLEADGETIRELLDAASAKHGPRFASQLRHCKIILNGAEASDLDARVTTDDELAILPPVAGG